MEKIRISFFFKMDICHLNLSDKDLLCLLPISLKRNYHGQSIATINSQRRKTHYVYLSGVMQL